MKKFVLLVLLLTICRLQVSACDPEPGAQHFPKLEVPPARITSGYFSVYNGLNGLPCNDIRSILIVNPPLASETLVIVGTTNRGLMIFAGESWHTSSPEGLFSFPEITVTALVRIDDNNFYAGTPMGIFKGTFINNRFEFSQVARNHQAIMNVNAIAPQPDEPENFLVACDRTAGVLSQDFFSEFNIPPHLNPSGFSAVIACDLGSFAGCNGGLYQITGQGLSPFTGEAEKIGWVNSLAKAGDRLFIASSNGVNMLREKGELEPLLPGVWSTCLAFSAPPEEALSGKDFKSFEISGNYGEMIQEEDSLEGLRARYAGLQREYEEYTRRYAGQQQADQDAVMAMYQKFFDFQDAMQQAMTNRVGQSKLVSPLIRGLWVGTQDTGLVIFATNGQRYHLTADNSKLPADHVTAIACSAGGETWVGTANAGIMRYSSRPIGGKGKIQNLLNCRPTRIKVLADMLAVGTKTDGMHLYDIKNLQSLGHFTSLTSKDFHSEVTDFALDKNGCLWVTGSNGVLVWDGKRWLKIPVAGEDRLITPRAARIAIDSLNRVFVAFASAGRIFQQVYYYNGSRLVRTDPEAIQGILAASGTQQLEAIKTHSLNGVYMRDFDFVNASAALAVFETGEDSTVSALLNTEHYLLIGLKNGNQKIFDGQSYKQLSKKGTGNIGDIVNLFRLPGGTVVIQGNEGVSEFDGQHYKLIESPATGPGFKITDMCPDQLNPETYRISFSSSEGGGYARYQETFWEKFYAPFAVISMAQADRIIFMASPEGVHYLIE